MFEDKTYTNVLNDVLEQIPNSLDKREGSVIYNAVAPFAMVISEFYKDLNARVNELYATTATGNFLDDIVGMFGVTRKAAVCSIRQGNFYNSSDQLMDVETGKRFSIDGIIFAVYSKISTGIYKMKCEMAGEIGNVPNGNLIPIDAIPGLAIATLSDILISGEEAETDDELRDRFYNSVNSVAFGGNVADYKEKVKEIEGIGAVKVLPAWDGGGTVKLILLDSNLNSASAALVNNVSNAMGENGSGLAPIGHTVTTVAATNYNINISLDVSLKEGYTLEAVTQNITNAISNYFTELKEDWEDAEEIIVRIIQIESRIISADGVLDIANLKMNNATTNITLSNYQIPYLSGVITNEV